jgi:hypothetical protein
MTSQTRSSCPGETRAQWKSREVTGQVEMGQGVREGACQQLAQLSF